MDWSRPSKTANRDAWLAVKLFRLLTCFECCQPSFDFGLLTEVFKFFELCIKRGSGEFFLAADAGLFTPDLFLKP